VSIADAALYATLYWPRDDAITMVAIAGAESSWRNDAQGDYYTIFPPDEQLTKFAYSCNGYTSFGLWQVHTPAHHAMLERRTGSTDPCVWRDLLFDPDSNANIAREIWDTQGFGAWSQYNNDAYLAYRDQATAAVDAVLPAPPPPRPWFPPLPPIPYFLLDLEPVEPPAGAVSDFRDLAPVEPPGPYPTR
jgi:hypothetical protein